MNKDFLGMLYYKKRKQEKELEKEKVRKTLEARNIYSSFITNLRIPTYFSVEMLQTVNFIDDWAEAVWCC